MELTARVSRSCGYDHRAQKRGVVIALNPSARSLHNRDLFSMSAELVLRKFEKDSKSPLESRLKSGITVAG
jgi:hypothetical protein